MTALAIYRKLRHKAEVLSDQGGYELGTGEMNPSIVLRFAELLADEEYVTAFEPFANPDGRTFEPFREAGVLLTAHTLTDDCHPGIIVVDSATEEPEGNFDGVLFHPPYFGSRPFTDDPRDLSQATDVNEWLVMMESAADIVMEHLASEGIVCAVGRRYRHGGEEVKLDEWLVEVFAGKLVPIEVWFSEPDIAIVLRFKE